MFDGHGYQNFYQGKIDLQICQFCCFLDFLHNCNTSLLGVHSISDYFRHSLIEFIVKVYEQLNTDYFLKNTLFN